MGSTGQTPHLLIHSFGSVLSYNITTGTSLNNHMQYTMKYGKTGYKTSEKEKNLPNDGVPPHQGDLSTAFTLELKPHVF